MARTARHLCALLAFLSCSALVFAREDLPASQSGNALNTRVGQDLSSHSGMQGLDRFYPTDVDVDTDDGDDFPVKAKSAMLDLVPSTPSVMDVSTDTYAQPDVSDEDDDDDDSAFIESYEDERDEDDDHEDHEDHTYDDDDDEEEEEEEEEEDDDEHEDDEHDDDDDEEEENEEYEVVDFISGGLAELIRVSASAGDDEGMYSYGEYDSNAGTYVTTAVTADGYGEVYDEGEVMYAVYYDVFASEDEVDGWYDQSSGIESMTETDTLADVIEAVMNELDSEAYAGGQESRPCGMHTDDAYGMYYVTGQDPQGDVYMVQNIGPFSVVSVLSPLQMMGDMLNSMFDTMLLSAMDVSRSSMRQQQLRMQFPDQLDSSIEDNVHGMSTVMTGNADGSVTTTTTLFLDNGDVISQTTVDPQMMDMLDASTAGAGVLDVQPEKVREMQWHEHFMRHPNLGLLLLAALVVACCMVWVAVIYQGMNLRRTFLSRDVVIPVSVKRDEKDGSYMLEPLLPDIEDAADYVKGAKKVDGPKWMHCNA